MSRVAKNVRIWPNNTTLRTDKDLKSKNVRGEKVYLLAKESIQKENFKSKPKKNQLEKGLFFGVTLIQAVVAINTYTLL